MIATIRYKRGTFMIIGFFIIRVKSVNVIKGKKSKINNLQVAGLSLYVLGRTLRYIQFTNNNWRSFLTLVLCSKLVLFVVVCGGTAHERWLTFNKFINILWLFRRVSIVLHILETERTWKSGIYRARDLYNLIKMQNTAFNYNVFCWFNNWGVILAEAKLIITL